MKSPKIGYLKGYYGYKNFGDELLGLGVIRYLFQHYPLEKLYIEVDNVDWFSTWLKRHETYLGDTLCKVKLVSKSNKKDVIFLSILSPKVHLFLGGGEIFAPARGWFYGGGNMFILYFWKFFTKKVTLLGGVSQATTKFFRFLYRWTLPYVEKIILRDQGSYDYIKSTYNRIKPTPNIILYHDFGYDVVSDKDINCQSLSISTIEKVMSKTGLLCPYLLVNTNPYVDMSKLTEKLTMLTQKTEIYNLVYFSCDDEDKPLFITLSTLNIDIDVDKKLTQYGHVNVDKNTTHVDKGEDKKCLLVSSNNTPIRQQFNWTEHDISTIMAVCRCTTEALGVRLHFIAMMAWLGIPFQYVVYQEKIEKFLANSQSYKKVE